jgi:hypothetical protein
MFIHFSYGRILRSPMDGSHIQWLHPIEKIVNPVAMTLDAVKRRIYWADVRLYSISSCEYNGNGQRSIVSNAYGTPLSIAFSENQIIWSNYDGKKMRVYDLNQPDCSGSFCPNSVVGSNHTKWLPLTMPPPVALIVNYLVVVFFNLFKNLDQKFNFWHFFLAI